MGIFSEWNKKRKLEKILYSIGKDFEYMTDSERFGRRDYWAKSTERWLDGKLIDDCDGFALEAHERCTQDGFKARLVECRRETKDGIKGHLFCEVDGWILHNQGKQGGIWWIETKEDLMDRGYYFVKISDYELTSINSCWYEVE